ncbi:MAG: hypothetical protein PHE31_04355 [Tissierellia bacterium]|nr:hypothetical protein [Tissierellia bacterium]
MNKTDNKNQENNTSFKPSNNIIEEVKKLEQQMKDPNVKTFKKNINWNQKGISAKNQETLLKDIYECLLRIETKLEDLIKKQKTPS